MVLMTTVPLVGAVQLHHTERPPGLPAWFGSPGSLVAPTLYAGHRIGQQARQGSPIRKHIIRRRGKDGQERVRAGGAAEGVADHDAVVARVARLDAADGVARSRRPGQRRPVFAPLVAQGGGAGRRHVKGQAPAGSRRFAAAAAR